MEKINTINQSFRDTIGGFLLSNIPKEVWHDNNDYESDKEQNKVFSSYDFYHEGKEGDLSYYVEISFFANNPTEYKLYVEIEEENKLNKRISKVIHFWHRVEEICINQKKEEMWNNTFNVISEISD